MKRWKVPTIIQRHTWSVIEFPEMNVVVPSEDIQPHDIESLHCPCNPRVEAEMVVHNCFEDQVSIDESLAKLFS